MATQAALRGAEWDVVDVHWGHGPSPVQYVFRKVNKTWKPWVVVATSALMKRNGATGLGLYAARRFKRDDFVGRYGGTVVGTFAHREAALDSEECKRRVRQGHDKLMTRLAPGGGVELVDGERSGPPFLPRINDPRGTMLKPNVTLTPGGWIRVAQASVPTFDLDKGVDDNIASELRYEYGDEYWAIMNRVGASSAHAIDLTMGATQHDMKGTWQRLATGTHTFQSDVSYFEGNASKDLTRNEKHLLWSAWLENDSPRSTKFVRGVSTYAGKPLKLVSEFNALVVQKGGVFHIPKGTSFYSVRTAGTDNGVWVGWKGSYNPPTDMAGRSLLGRTGRPL